MQEKISSGTYLTIFAVSFIGYIIAFFLGVWVGGKSTVKYRDERVVVNRNTSDNLNPDYEEVGEESDSSLSTGFSDSGNRLKEEGKKEKKPVEIKQKTVKKKTEKKAKSKINASKKTTKTKSKKTLNNKVSKNAKVTNSAKKDSETRFMLQIGAFKRMSDAKKLKAKFERKGYSVFIVKEKGKKSVFYKVRIGTFYSKKIAYKVMKKIRREDRIKAWLVPIK